jgi:hypothetical protein
MDALKVTTHITEDSPACEGDKFIVIDDLIISNCLVRNYYIWLKFDTLNQNWHKKETKYESFRP